MKIYLYCLREYFKYVLGTVVLTVFLFVLFDFIHKTTKYFAEFNPRGEDIVSFYLYQIPGQIVQALPIASLLGSVISMILLSRTNEITAMRAVGLGPWQLAIPLVTGGAILSFCSFLLGEYTVPRYALKTHYVQQVKIEGRRGDAAASGGRWIRDKDRFIFYKEYDPLSKEIQKVFVVDIADNFRPVRALESDKAVFAEDGNIWSLKQTRVDYFKKNKTLERSEYLAQTNIEIPIDPRKMVKDSRKPNELSIHELDELISRGERSGADTVPFKVDYQGKMAYPFAALVVSLIGLKFGYRSERSTDTAKGVLLAFFIGISYWVILSAGGALGLRGDVSPIFSAWLPNMVVLCFIAIDAWIAEKA